jgi:hypothetical protein
LISGALGNLVDNTILQMIGSYLGDQGVVDNTILQMIGFYLDDQDEPSPLQGRRLAVLGRMVGQRIGVVPCDARPGDLCLSILPSLSLYIVRREHNVNPAWKQAVLQSAEFVKLRDRIQEKARVLRGADEEKEWIQWYSTETLPVDFWGRVLGECFTRPSPIPLDLPNQFLLADHIVALL